MAEIVIFIVLAFWGMMSVKLIMQGLLFCVTLFASIVGIIKRRTILKVNVIGIGVSSIGTLLMLSLLYFGNYLLLFWFGYAYTDSIVFWIFAIMNCLFMLLKFPEKILKIWKNSTEPGSIESDILKRKMKTESF